MAGFTNRGKYLMFVDFFRNPSEFTNFYLALCTATTTPNADTNTLGQLTQIATGNGYSDGGYQLSRNSTDFDQAIEDDAADRCRIQIKDVVFTAAGGNIPSNSVGAKWAVLTTDEGTVANRQVIGFWDLTSDRVVSDTQALTLVDLELQGTE